MKKATDVMDQFLNTCHITLERLRQKLLTIFSILKCLQGA